MKVDFTKDKVWKGRKYKGDMPFISCEKEHIEWINRHNRNKIGK